MAVAKPWRSNHSFIVNTGTKTGGCTTHLWSVEQLLNKRDILANYTITIIPKYFSFDDNEPLFGTPSQLTFTYGVQGNAAGLRHLYSLFY